jgi:probable DNA repair protein
MLLIWGFTSDRTLSSSEYQIFEKYQVESLILNKMSTFYKKSSLKDVIEILTAHMNAVIFQPQSGPANIYILGSLEAEGLFFDYAWVSSMTSDFLPGKIQMPLFIPPKTSIEYCLPKTSFTLISKESEVTLDNLLNLSSSLIISYSKTSNSRDELPSPYLDFEDYPNFIGHETLPKEMELLDDFIAPELDNFEIKRGVATLQDQISCSFKGFVSRLNIQEFNEPQIGLSRLEQGSLVHKILENFFNAIPSSSDLKKLPEDKLQEEINKHINSAIQLISQSNFKSIEKERLIKIINEYIKLEKNREYFQVIKTESESKVDVNGLQFSTRIDRMDQMKDGTNLIIDYKTGQNVNLSQLTGDPLDQAQLPIYAITNPVAGIAFATVNSKDCQFKAITKNKFDLPLSQQAIKRMPEWNEQVSEWELELNSASQKFQEGVAEVLPTTNACDYCDYDLLCRFEKSSNN